jgi:ATP-dependent helicase/nuclease subunit A
MTRARDVLYVCGIRGERTEKDTWYSLVRGALAPEAALDPETGELAAPACYPQSERPAIAPKPVPSAELDLHPPHPAWLDRAAPPPPVAPRPLRPSGALVEPDRGPVPEAPALVGAEAARRRGILVHRLLQSLPGVPEERREAVSLAYLERENCIGADAALIWQETEKVLAEPSLAALFGPDGRAELDLAGRIATPSGDYVVSGRIDRLVRNAAGWRILDLKTDRAVPADAAAVDPAYVLQLAIYRHLIQEIEPGAAVRAGLLYTAEPVLVDIPEMAMDEALERLRSG